MPSVAPSFEFMINSFANVFIYVLLCELCWFSFDHILNFTCRTNVNKFIFTMTRILAKGEHCLSLIRILFEKIII